MPRGLQSFTIRRYLFSFLAVLLLVVSCDSAQPPVAPEEPGLETQGATLSLSSATSTLNANVTVKSFNSAASRGGYSIKWRAPLNMTQACDMTNKCEGIRFDKVFGSTNYLMIGEVVGRKNTWVRAMVSVSKDGKRSVYGQQVIYDNSKEATPYKATIVTDLHTGAVIKSATSIVSLIGGKPTKISSMGGLSGVSTFDRMLTPTNWGNYVYNVTAKPAESPSNFANACSPTDLTGLQVQCGGGAGGTPNHPSTPDPNPPSCDPRSCTSWRNARNGAALGAIATGGSYVASWVAIGTFCPNPVTVAVQACTGAVVGNQITSVGVGASLGNLGNANKNLNACLKARKGDC